MPRTIETTVYKFDELSEKAQRRALDHLIDINVHYDWWDSTYDDAKQIGLEIEGFDLDRNRHATGKFTKLLDDVIDAIKVNHGEDCETYKTACEYEAKLKPLYEQYKEELASGDYPGEYQDAYAEIEEEFLKALLDDYAIMLQNESEYLVSDEAIKETIEANDYEFTEEGRLV